jgi:hypothetical protein
MFRVPFDAISPRMGLRPLVVIYFSTIVLDEVDFVTIQDASLAKGSWRSVYVVDIEASGLGGFRYRFTRKWRLVRRCH